LSSQFRTVMSGEPGWQPDFFLGNRLFLHVRTRFPRQKPG
jgi:hypothetical protein